MEARKRSGVLKGLGWILSAVFLLILAAAFYVTAIMANPDAEDSPVSTDAPLRYAAAVRVLESADQLQDLVRDFPAPSLIAMPDRGLNLIAGGMEDLPVDGGYARVLTLRYQAQDGSEVTLRSIWPASASDAIRTDGWHLSAVSGLTISGMPSFRLERSGQIRLQCQSPDAIYLVETAQMDGTALSMLLQPIQLVLLTE